MSTARGLLGLTDRSEPVALAGALAGGGGVWLGTGGRLVEGGRLATLRPLSLTNRSMNGETVEPFASTGGGGAVGCNAGDWASAGDEARPPNSKAKPRNEGQTGLFFRNDPARFMGSSIRSRFRVVLAITLSVFVQNFRRVGLALPNR
jgi:hypothetical protein